MLPQDPYILLSVINTKLRDGYSSLSALCEGLDKPVGEDAKIREVLIEALGGYLEGSRSREDTVQKIEDGLKMYLAE